VPGCGFPAGLRHMSPPRGNSGPGRWAWPVMFRDARRPVRVHPGDGAAAGKGIKPEINDNKNDKNKDGSGTLKPNITRAKTVETACADTRMEVEYDVAMPVVLLERVDCAKGDASSVSVSRGTPSRESVRDRDWRRGVIRRRRAMTTTVDPSRGWLINRMMRRGLVRMPH